MNRVLLTTSMMTPIERSVGRFLRAPEHPFGEEPAPAGAGESTPPPNNTGGNPAESGNPPAETDNTGQGDPLKGFWNEQPEEAASDESATQSAAESQALGTELRGMIEGFNAPPVFTKEMAEQVADGNFDGINAAIVAANKAAISHSVLAGAKLIKAVTEKLQTDFEARIQTALGNKDSSDFLKQTFPQAKDPTLAPLVERVWNQALANSKGDRDKATTLTRGMLQAMGKEFAPEDLRNPPADSTAGINTAASRSLVDSLLQRDGS